MFVCDELPYLTNAPMSWADAVEEVVSCHWHNMETDVLSSCVLFIQKSGLDQGVRLKWMCRLLHRDPCVGSILLGLDVLPKFDGVAQESLDLHILTVYARISFWRKSLLRLDSRFRALLRKGLAEGVHFNKMT